MELKKGNLIWIVILLALVVMFGFAFSLSVIEDNYNKGYNDGINEVNNLIVEIVNEDHYINVWDQTNNKQITLMEYNHSKELCLEILEGVFE